ncbi:[FeFe] hydrogenase, group A [Tepidimicrobium xylanilyticum]|uniref:NADH-quinone oxidoreductase subunit G n=1 Tax=Tepidimicrobium xylanilyticum TaxID=1123352 RepID=A0A1H3B747_9FIRM|nr:[FeFe] hydrogenase, group A [Tepidimicrobium xylanilyticum]SDX37782.1 NADH-quinone oxidoreductase subunit G [Tepidimicrobium xylanilyticum]
MKGTMIVDGRQVEFDKEKNVLEVVRKAGIDLPTFCYHSELSIYGACRMCIVEDKWGNIFASCSQLPRDGMEVFTNTKKVQKYRKLILEMILANHDRDCTTCTRTGKCQLQELAIRFGIKDIRFDPIRKRLPIDKSSLSIIRNPNKCILCGDCVRVCEEVQGVGALSFVNRGSDITVAPAFNRDIAEVNCVNCGQCRAVCPTAAIIIKNDNGKVWEVVHDKSKRVIAQIAPAVRVALGEEFGLEPGQVTIGKIVAALKKIGVDEVYDTAFSADMTVIEESKEFLERFETGEKLPLFTSCCPGWVKFAENKYPDMVDNISTCKSPQQMFGAVIKEYYKEKDKDENKGTILISVMPCTAKKAEAAREEFEHNGVRDVDIVITTQELALLIKEAGINFEQLEEESFDMPFGLASGSGIIFGATGGVAEAVVTRLLKNKPDHNTKDLLFSNVRGMDNIKEASFNLDGKEIKIAVVHGLNNADELIKQIKSGKRYYDFIEVMACPGGCIAGGGQPIPMNLETRKGRAKGLYRLDRISHIKSSDTNPLVMSLFEGILKDNHELLHVHKKMEVES